MTILRLYARVLGLLGPQIRLGWVLAFANVALAAAQFAEPVLFGRIIDSARSRARPGARVVVVSSTSTGRSLGWLRSFHDCLRRARRALRRQACPSAPPGSAL